MSISSAFWRIGISSVGSVSWFCIFFSTMSFTMLENAMSVIFFHRVAIRRRHFLVSALIPFLFIALIAAGLLMICLISGALETLDDEQVRLFGYECALHGLSGSSRISSSPPPGFGRDRKYGDV